MENPNESGGTSQLGQGVINQTTNPFNWLNSQIQSGVRIPETHTFPARIYNVATPSLTPM